MNSATPAPAAPAENYSTIEVARMLGLAVRSVQLMVDRQELEAWKTPGGHRRISRASVERWLTERSRPVPAELSAHAPLAADTAPAPAAPAAVRSSEPPGAPPRRRAGDRQAGPRPPRVLLIEDSIHFQNLVSLLVRQRMPEVELHIANDGITGLAMYGQLQPDVLVVDILLPGIDGAALISSLRSQPQFANSRLIVVTSLDEAARAPYAFALEGVPVVHKPRLVAELPALLEASLGAVRRL